MFRRCKVAADGLHYKGSKQQTASSIMSSTTWTRSGRDSFSRSAHPNSTYYRDSSLIRELFKYLLTMESFSPMRQLLFESWSLFAGTYKIWSRNTLIKVAVTLRVLVFCICSLLTMSASPFRSHLLQQWARGSQGRAPAAVVPWLHPHRSTSPLPVPDVQHDDRTDHRHCRCVSCLSISTIQSNPSKQPTTILSSPTAPESPKHAASMYRYYTTTATSTSTTTTRAPTGISNPTKKTRVLHQQQSIRDKSTSSYTKDHTSSMRNEPSTGDDDILTRPHATSAFQSILLSRRTASRLRAVGDSDPEQQQQVLLHALDRAVKCAQMAPNHKRTEPFSFRRFMAGSQTAQQLADISYHVTFRKTESHPNAESKRQKWLDIPAFLVTLLHENQQDVGDNSSQIDPYQALPYMPPATERQLEDVSTVFDSISFGLCYFTFCICKMMSLIRWNIPPSSPHLFHSMLQHVRLSKMQC